MQPHQERVVTEKKELDEKLSKLRAFARLDNPVFYALDPTERLRLLRQLEIMEQYSTVLGERIQAFSGEG